ncbi:MAG: hypothetical protein OEX83_06125, partial [Gammaproteobacteria bacterium]|nr:hypothetical protein [Gammaproteobacteria bacterium]
MYDDNDYQRLVQRLTQEGVDFYESGDKQIFYPITEREKVDAITEEIHGATDKTKMGAIVKGKDASKISQLLDEAGIAYDTASLEGTGDIGFSWSNDANKRAMKIVLKAMS